MNYCVYFNASPLLHAVLYTENKFSLIRMLNCHYIPFNLIMILGGHMFHTYANKPVV